MRRENFEEAAVHLEKLLKITPDDPGLNFSLGYSLAKLDRHGEAVPLLEKALKKSETGFTILINLADAYNKTGRYDEAIEKAKRAMQLKPETWEPYTLVAMDMQERRNMTGR